MPTDGEVFGAFLAGLAIGAFALHAWRTWREVEADDEILRHYNLDRDVWDAMTEAQRRLSRLAYFAKLDRQDGDRG